MSFRAREYLSRPVELLRMRRWMARTPRWDPERMQSWQLARLRELLDGAKRTVPHYREALGDLDSGSIASLDDWSRVPILEKETLRSRTEEMVASDAELRRPVWRTTSGTTGAPMRILHDREVDAAAFNVFWRQWAEAPGWRMGRRQLVLDASAGDWAYQRVSRIAYVPSFELEPSTVSRFVDVVRRYRPPLLRGHPSSLVLLARLLGEAGEALHFPGVVTHSEMLLPAYRDQIERSFNSKVIDHYTHWERAASIGQCVVGSYHVHADYGLVEIVREDGRPAAPGESGRIVATGLHNRAMPLLRYDTGDLARRSVDGTCTCGSRFPVLEGIEGRFDDFVVTADGRQVKGLSNVFKDLNHVRESQIVQRKVGRIVVRVVTDPGYEASNDEATLLGELRRRLGNVTHIDVERCEALPRTAGGKVRLVISDLDRGASHRRGARS